MMDAVGLGQAIKRKKIRISEAVALCAEAMRQKEPQVHAFLTDLSEEARTQAEQMERSGALLQADLPLAGVPFAVKDNISLQGVRLTCASRMLAQYRAAYTATALQRLLDGGCICMGKTNLDEFAFGSTGESSYFGPTSNPLDLRRVAGGSSSGSAAAVAAGECFFALGSDSGGSVRLPAAYCGLVGLLPTYGRVSRYGLVAHVSSMDQIGCITRSVRDSAAVLAQMAGKDPRDATSVTAPKQFAFSADIRDYRIGVWDPEEIGAEACVLRTLQAAAQLLKEHAADLAYFRLEELKNAESIYRVIERAEASSNLARFDGIKYGGTKAKAGNLAARYAAEEEQGFGQEVKDRIRRGRYYLSEGYETVYLPAVEARWKLQAALMEAFRHCDLLLLPVSKDIAPLKGTPAEYSEETGGADAFTTAANLAQLPAIALPFGVQDGMPVGVQLMAAPFCEAKLFAAAAVLEKNAPNEIKRKENVHTI